MLNRLVLSRIAQECDRFPTRTLDEVWSSVQAQLDPVDVTSQLATFRNTSSWADTFMPVLVPNPRYWKKYLNRDFSFFLLRAKSRNYDELIDTLVSEFPDLSHFICYGDVDAVLRVVGAESDIEQLLTYIERQGFQIVELPVLRIPLYYGYAVSGDNELKRVEISTAEIDVALAGDARGVSNSTIQTLLDAGLILGAVYREDAHETGRIRAFVAISFEYQLKLHEQKQFEEALITASQAAFRNGESLPLSSIYRCGGRYSYMLEAICADQQQLDTFTDVLQNLQPTPEDTTTFIVAKARFGRTLYSSQRQETVVNFEILNGVVKTSLEPILEKLRESLPPDMNMVFATADSKQQLEATRLYDELVLSNPYLKQENYHLVEPYFVDFVQGVLMQRKPAVKSAGLGLVRDVVEPEHLKLVDRMLEVFFQRDAKRFHKLLGTDDHLIGKWGLQKWATVVYPKWNKHRLYGAVIEIPNDILQSFSQVGYARNILAHAQEEKTLPELTHLVRETFTQSYVILNWIRETATIFDAPVIQAAADFVARAEMDDDEKNQQLLWVISATQVRQLELFESLSNQNDVRWQELQSALEKLGEGIDINRTQIMALVEELVLPRVAERERPRIKRILDSLTSSAQALPENVFANILAGIALQALGQL